MNYTEHTSELTASLQELAARRLHDKGNASPMPKTLDEGALVLSGEVSSFLDSREAYAAKTRDVSIGTY